MGVGYKGDNLSTLGWGEKGRFPARSGVGEESLKRRSLLGGWVWEERELLKMGG